MHDRDWVIAGLLLNSALALIGIFVAGIVTGTPLAWKLAIASAALTYFLYLFQFMGGKPPLVGTAQAAAIVAGGLGFIMLLVK
jgi:hypothetical protein